MVTEQFQSQIAALKTILEDKNEEVEAYKQAID